MKKLFFISLSLALALTFTAGNNFGFGFSTGADKPDTLSLKEFNKLMQESVINPIHTALEKQNPHMFMTKCYSYVYYDISGREVFNGQGGSEAHLLSKVPDNIYLFKSNAIIGNVKLSDCGSNETICAYSFTPSTKEVKLKESYFKQWEDRDAFIKRLFGKKE